MPAQLIIIPLTIHLLQRNADGKCQFLEVKLATVIFTEKIAADLPLEATLSPLQSKLIGQQVEDQMEDAVSDLFS